MAPTMEQLRRRVAEWRACLLDKGFKVNAGKAKVMVGSSRGKMIVNSVMWPCMKGVQANSVQCTLCILENAFTNGEVVTCEWLTVSCVCDVTV